MGEYNSKGRNKSTMLLFASHLKCFILYEFHTHARVWMSKKISNIVTSAH